jgi:isoleucyl-tRNA synthetase
MWEVLSALTRFIAPILCFTAEEIWQEMRKMSFDLEESVHLSMWPETSAKFAEGLDPSVALRWDKVMEARGAVSRALEAARTQSIIGHSLDAEVWMNTGDWHPDAAGHITDDVWETITIVSSFRKTDVLPDASVVHNDEETGIAVAVNKNPNEKCPRCWKRRPEVKDQGVCHRCADALERRSK